MNEPELTDQDSRRWVLHITALEARFHRLLGLARVSPPDASEYQLGRHLAALIVAVKNIDGELERGNSPLLTKEEAIIILSDIAIALSEIQTTLEDDQSAILRLINLLG